MRHIAPQVDRRFPATFALAALVALAGLAAFAPPAFGLQGASPGGLLRDFNAFYCAGDSLGRGADPYREEPLASCERRPKPAPLLQGTRGLAMPAPLPPYALAPFVLLARLPYALAATLWTLFLTGCLAATIAALRRLTGLPSLVVTAALILGDGYAAMCLGQIAPVAVAAIALAALLLAGERDELAAVAASFSMLEPHVGLPVCLALFVWCPRARLPLAGAALVCAALCVAVAGLPTTVEYFRDVVPAHALSEVANEKQLSLTYALHRLGVADVPALRAGEFWYLAMLLLGTGAAGAALRRGAGRAYVALLPPVFALTGGPFVHIVQLSAVLPAGLMLYTESGGAARRTLGVALVLLAVPWIQFVNLGTSFQPLAALVCAILAWNLLGRRPLVASAAALAAILFLAAVSAVIRTQIGDAGPALLAQYDPRALAERSWSVYVRALGSVNAPTFDVTKIPTLAGLLALACCVPARLRSAKTNAPPATIAPTGNGGDGSRRIALR